jgi:alpha-aminoadipate/glutamate carrier protein LysW
MENATCPACEAEIELEPDELDEGDELDCDACGAELVVISLTPLKLGPYIDSEVDDLGDDEQDYDDDEEDEDEEADDEDEDDEDEEDEEE